MTSGSHPGRLGWIVGGCLLAAVLAVGLLLASRPEREAPVPASLTGETARPDPGNPRTSTTRPSRSPEALPNAPVVPADAAPRDVRRAATADEPWRSQEAGDAPERSGPQLVSDLQSLLASRRDFEDASVYRERYAALRRAIVARGDETRPVLEEKLGAVHTPPRLRRASATLLGAIRSEASLPLLADVLREDPADEVRRAAARALGNYSDNPGARQILVEELVHGEPFSGSYAVVFSLSEFGNPADIALFEELARNDQDVSVRIQAVHALGRFGDPALIPFLESVAETDPHPDPRQMATQVIADLRR